MESCGTTQCYDFNRMNLPIIVKTVIRGFRFEGLSCVRKKMWWAWTMDKFFIQIPNFIQIFQSKSVISPICMKLFLHFLGVKSNKHKIDKNQAKEFCMKLLSKICYELGRRTQEKPSNLNALRRVSERENRSLSL